MAFKTSLRSVLMSGVNLVVAHRRLLAGMAIAFVLCAVLVAACAGCGGSDGAGIAKRTFDTAVARGEIPERPSTTLMDDAQWAEYIRSQPGFGSMKGQPKDKPQPEKPLDTPQTAINDLSRTLGWVAGICTLLSALACVASIFVPVIPRRGAMLALGVSIGIGLVRVVVIAYGLVTAHVAFWASVAALILAAITVAWPMALAWRNALLLRTSKKLEWQGDARASVALKIEAAPSMLPSKQDRKDAVAEIDMKVRP